MNGYPHLLSILFYLTNTKYNNALINYNKFKNKKKTNLEIYYKNKNFEFNIFREIILPSQNMKFVLIRIKMSIFMMEHINKIKNKS